jgi:crotonobetainyl-CoA:carnitine CoA-transferase CaiB-like acyl-CoA transferase
MSEQNGGTGSLAGIRVLDASHQYSGAFAASLLRDLGAEVIAIETPQGSPIRTMLPKRGLDSLWWLSLQREKRNITLKLSTPEGQDIYKALAREADVLIENFRPGTMEKWGIGPQQLEAAGVSAVMLRISGFGQTGPSRDRPGYGTIAEAMSGFAHLNGFPDGPPALPSVTLADGVAAVFGSLGVLAALLQRSNDLPTPSVQVVDTALVESLFKIIPNQVTAYDQLGIVMRRYGNSLLEKGVLRDLFKTADGRDVAVGGGIGAPSIKRTLEAVDAPDLAAEVAAGVLNGEGPDVMDFLRRGHKAIATWVGARTYDEVEKVLASSGVVFAPIYNVEDIVRDEHYRARDSIISVADENGVEMAMTGIVPKIDGSNVSSRRAGAPKGAFNEEILCGLLGMSPESLKELADKGVV